METRKRRKHDDGGSLGPAISPTGPEQTRPIQIPTYLSADLFPFHKRSLAEPQPPAPAPAKPRGRRLERIRTITKKQTRERLAGAGSLSELRDAINELDREWGEPIRLSRHFSKHSYQVPVFGGERPRYCLSQYHQKAVDVGLFYQTRTHWNHHIVSWDESSVLYRGARGLLLLSREEFEACFSDIVCPFCGERYVVCLGCEHVLAVNDQILEVWDCQNAEDVYRAWLHARGLFKRMPEYGPQALPGSVVASCRMQGPAYRRWGSVRLSVLFAPDELLGELRDRNREQWNWDLESKRDWERRH